MRQHLMSDLRVQSLSIASARETHRTTSHARSPGETRPPTPSGWRILVRLRPNSGTGASVLPNLPLPFSSNDHGPRQSLHHLCIMI